MLGSQKCQYPRWPIARPRLPRGGGSAGASVGQVQADAADGRGCGGRL